MAPNLGLVEEGSTELFVPAESLVAKDPKTFPAFFNPAARTNRDVSVAIASVTGPSDFLDGLAGVGARGVRVAREASEGVLVTMVEFNEVSARIAARNAKRNGVQGRCSVVREESNAYLASRFGRLERFDAVDVDPFGTPAPYVQGALGAVQDGGVLSLTATDTATLCGVYPKVAWRRYGALVTRSEFAHEAAVRVLLGFCARMGGVLDVGIAPVAAHCTLHYVRVYARVIRGAASSDACLKEVGYVVACPHCHENGVSSALSYSCGRCGRSARPIGPQWLGRLAEERVVSEAGKVCHERGWSRAEAALGPLAASDSFPPFGFELEKITSREGESSVPFQDVVDALGSTGRSAMKQPFGSSGIKTDASYGELVAAVRRCARKDR